MAQNSVTWEDLCPADGASLTIRFDWHDDFSSWRLDELTGDIEEAAALLTRAGVEVKNVSSLYDLESYPTALRGLYLKENSTDSDVRKGLLLADLLDIGYELQGLDASDQYESTVERVVETLEAWESRPGWYFTDDDWEVSAVDAWESAVKHRNGLGDRWSITFTDSDIELPNGVVVKRIAADKPLRKVFDEITVDFAYVDDMSGVATALTKILPDSYEQIAQAVCDLAAGRRMDVTPETIDKLGAMSALYSDEAFSVIIDTASRLAEDWFGTESELLIAAESLVDLPSETSVMM